MAPSDRHRPEGFIRSTPGTGSLVTEIPGRGKRFWEFPGLDLLDDLTEADWLRSLTGQGEPGQQVRNFVPDVFESYARVFFPLGPIGLTPPPTWSEVAERNGRVVHAEMTAEAISRPAPGKETDPPGELYDYGYLPLEQLAVLAGIQARRTTTPETTFFGLWEGYADLMVGYEALPGGDGLRRVPEPPMFSMPIRRYLVYRGQVDAWRVFGQADYDHVPDLWWPKDKAWCLVTDTDFCWLYVGGSRACIDDILSAPGIEALATEPGHGVGIASISSMTPTARPGEPTDIAHPALGYADSGQSFDPAGNTADGITAPDQLPATTPGRPPDQPARLTAAVKGYLSYLRNWYRHGKTTSPDYIRRRQAAGTRLGERKLSLGWEEVKASRRLRPGSTKPVGP